MEANSEYIACFISLSVGLWGYSESVDKNGSFLHTLKFVLVCCGSCRWRQHVRKIKGFLCQCLCLQCDVGRCSLNRHFRAAVYSPINRRNALVTVILVCEWGTRVHLAVGSGTQDVRY